MLLQDVLLSSLLVPMRPPQQDPTQLPFPPLTRKLSGGNSYSFLLISLTTRRVQLLAPANLENDDEEASQPILSTPVTRSKRKRIAEN